VPVKAHPYLRPAHKKQARRFFEANKQLVDEL
jgi:hypothetical protein